MNYKFERLFLNNFSCKTIHFLLDLHVFLIERHSMLLLMFILSFPYVIHMCIISNCLKMFYSTSHVHYVISLCLHLEWTHINAEWNIFFVTKLRLPPSFFCPYGVDILFCLFNQKNCIKSYIKQQHLRIEHTVLFLFENA